MRAIIKLKDANLPNGRLKNISMDVFDNEIITIIGPNGGGKTSLLKLIANIERPISGSVIVKKNCRISYMPQHIKFDDMLPMTVKNFLRINNQITSEEISNMTKMFGISEISDSQVNKISAGELQKVLFTKCILVNPNVILLDEPVSNLDLKAQENFYAILEKVKYEKKCTIIMASHDLHIVMNKTDRVICLNNSISCQGTMKDVEYHQEFIDLFGKNVAPYRHYHDR